MNVWKCVVLSAGALTAAVALPNVPQAAAAAARHSTAVIAKIAVPPDFYDLRAGLGAVWVLNPNEQTYSTLREIDPSTNRVVATHQLDSSAGGFAVGAGAIWVAMYYDNIVERIDTSGQVVARIKVGLQPQWTHVAFNSVWVSNHHGRSVSRIDPNTNTVIATIPAGDPHTFRSGPQDITSDGRYVYVGASNGDSPLETINPGNNAVVRRPGALPDIFCGDDAAVTLTVWSADPCSNTLYHLDTVTGNSLNSFGYGSGQIESLTVLGGDLWVAYDRTFDPNTGTGSGGALQERNPSNGSLLKTVQIGGDADVVRAAYSDLWVVDDSNGFVERVAP
jgi:YVTN family beta-propeller protein